MPYLIDGNNLLGAGRDRRLGIPVDEGELILMLSSFAAARRACLTIVFDGSRQSRPHAGAGTGSVRVRYADRRSADDVIVQWVRSSPAPKDIVVVTSDRDLRSRVRAATGRVMGCREFAAALTSVGDRRGEHEEEKPEANDVAMWERYFAGED